jgi:hypothetical protein
VIVPINRVKPHTDFTGDVESGLMNAPKDPHAGDHDALREGPADDVDDRGEVQNGAGRVTAFVWRTR